ncbi:MAG: hypothetical protein JWP91_3091 [Fibrobacteres bacterium]|nr:hypothetical protein [Fibrobacterota bacterium]
MNKYLGAFLVLRLLLVPVYSQPDNPPKSGDASCQEETAFDPKDTVAADPDAEGYYPLFNGKDFTGLWQSCLTRHSLGSVDGAIFRVDTLRKAIYSMQRDSGKTATGGVLMTKRKFDNYDLVFDFWPDFGNDAGIFNRTPASGICYKTTLSYLNGASLGGVWGEFGYPARDIRPFKFLGSESEISLGSPGINHYSWDSLTSKHYSQDFGCAPEGCNATDWLRLWDIDGWNQFRLQFYGGIEGTDAVKAKAWFRRVRAETWIPLIEDTTLVWPTPAGYIGFQVQGGGRFTGSRGTWYRNIRWRPLDDQGRPLHPANAIRPRSIDRSMFRMETGQTGISFLFQRQEAGRTIAIHSLDGRLVERLNGSTIRAIWSARGTAKGVYLVRIGGNRGRDLYTPGPIRIAW